MKTSKMNITILGFICVSLTAFLILVHAAQAGEKNVKYKIASYVTKMEVVLIPDIKGHIIGVMERRGVAIYENWETATYHSQLTFDSIKGQGASFSGYANLIFADGSTTISKLVGTVPEVKGKKIIKGTGDYIKGTGRFEGIKGKLSFSGKYVTPYAKDTTKGDMVLEVTSTYTLPK
jgi:hypothetical protein